MRPGLLLTILKEDGVLYLRILNFIHIGFINKDDEEGFGIKFIFGLHNIQFDFSITKRNIDYVIKRIKDQTGPKASA
jgi:hypothetical protein